MKNINTTTTKNLIAVLVVATAIVGLSTKPVFADTLYSGGTTTVGMEINKSVLNPKTNSWMGDIKLSDYKFKPGDEVKFKISYRNTGTQALKNVSIEDRLPAGMSFVRTNEGVNGDYNTSENKINFGVDDLDVNSGWKDIIFTAKINSDVKDTTLVNVAIFKVNGDEKARATASLQVILGIVAGAVKLPETGAAETGIMTILSVIGALFGVTLKRKA